MRLLLFTPTETGSAIARVSMLVYRALIDLDERIHRAIYKAAHNDLMEKTLGDYYVLALRIWMIALNRDEALEDAVEAHRPLLIDIAQGNADKAADRMRAHVQDFEKAMHRVLVAV